MASGIFTLKQQLQGLIQKAWTGMQKTPYVEYLVVAGGGGASAGGGGAGGLLQGIVPITTGSPITVTVGAGGASSTGVGSSGINSVFSNVTSIGGGGGGWRSITSATSGGSGGGSNADNPGYGGQGTFGQGNSGGTNPNSYNRGGGGGGAGTVGTSPPAAGADSVGGAGIGSAISGSITVYSAGGAGAATAASGSDNTGNGAVGSYGSPSGAGGSGIVIISYPDIYNAPTALTGTYTASTSGSGSLSFNGSSQYLQIPNNAALQFGTSSFTIEGWFYLTTATHLNNSFFSVGSYNSGVLLRYNTGFGSADYLYINGTQYNWFPNTYFTLNQWNHVALVRNGSAVAIYVNGTSVFTTTSSANISQSTATSVGTATHDTSGETWTGYISNFRIVNGSAVYTSNFTPSTKPLTAITNTAYLLNTVSGAQYVDSSTNGFAVTTTTNPTWNQLSPFATGLGYKNRVYTWTGSGTVTF